jgi:hypothetical protein
LADATNHGDVVLPHASPADAIIASLFAPVSQANTVFDASHVPSPAATGLGLVGIPDIKIMDSRFFFVFILLSGRVSLST